MHKLERKNIEKMIFASILHFNSFDFKRGNTLASFAETFSMMYELNVKDSRTIKVPMDFINQTHEILGRMMGYQSKDIDIFYRNLTKCCYSLLPFYRQVFTYYRMNKRIVVLNLMT